MHGAVTDPGFWRETHGVHRPALLRRRYDLFDDDNDRTWATMLPDSPLTRLLPAHFHHLLTGSQLIPTSMLCVESFISIQLELMWNNNCAVFQFAYSSLFGMFSAFVFVRTGKVT